MSTHPQAPAPGSRKPVTLPRLREMRTNAEPIAMLTCYDASFARLLDQQGVDCVLVGDSLGMVVQGLDSTLPVTLEEVAYHTRCVARGISGRVVDGRHAVRQLPGRPTSRRSTTRCD